MSCTVRESMKLYDMIILLLMPKMNFNSPCRHRPSVSLFMAVIFKFNLTLKSVNDESVHILYVRWFAGLDTCDRRQQTADSCTQNLTHQLKIHLFNFINLF